MKESKNERWEIRFFLTFLIFALAIPAGVLYGDDEETTKPDGAICLPGGPCVLPPEDGQGTETPVDQPSVNEDDSLPPNSPDAVPEERVVDLEKEPWLVESVNLPANHPVFDREKIVWADSLLWTALPDIVPEIPVEKWLTPLPEDRAGKYILIEVWATWCPPCRRSLNYLNYIAEKYKDDLIVVAICERRKKRSVRCRGITTSTT